MLLQPYRKPFQYESCNGRINPMMMPVIGKTVVMNNYLVNSRCSGPPTTTYIFDVANELARRKPVNETWPGMYRFVQMYVGWGPCGAADNGRCCISSLDTTQSQGYTSATYTAFKDESSLPLPMKNQNYCSVKYTGSNVRQMFKMCA